MPELCEVTLQYTRK